MSTETGTTPANLSALVSAEVERQLASVVERQLASVKDELAKAVAEVRERTVDNRCSIILFSSDLDKAMASFVLATGAAAAGLDVSMFFTFWGLSVLKKAGAPAGKKNLKEQMFSMMTPSSSLGLGTSKMNFFGVGSWMLRSMMKDKEIASLEDLMAIARDLGVRMMACTMSMDAMGVAKDQLVDGLEYGGVGAYMADATQSKVTLFI